jgi:hypothetical protein
MSDSNTFSKGMLKDYNETFIGEGFYTHAKNAVNNSHDGNVGVLGNEPANLHCVDFPYTVIGNIYITENQWVIFTTDDINSEIGIFDESNCSYTKLVNDVSLNFNRKYLITGIYRKRYDCERLIYWDDGNNPSRYVNIDMLNPLLNLPNQPFYYTEKIVNGCSIKTYTTLNPELLRISPIISYPCIVLSKGNISGSLPNGTYQIGIFYTINTSRFTNLLGLSNVQSVFSHENTSSSLTATLSNIDVINFDEFELVLVGTFNGNTIAKSLGYYSTSATIHLTIDRIDNEYVNVPLSEVVLRTDAIEKTNAMYSLNNYALRVGVYTKYKFNYQQQANNISVSWVAVKYSYDYYNKGGNNTSYMRDEVYSFFIRWVFNTGQKTESYHIPGRAPNNIDVQIDNSNNAFEQLNGEKVFYWQSNNTAILRSNNTYFLSDGGGVIASGDMGYWESTETYPNDRADIWKDLCGKNIRHHKFPDQTVNEILSHFTDDGQSIVLLGVLFDNITAPLDIYGNVETSIIGYEILRGSREGNKSIIAKGLINNMRKYLIPGNSNTTGLMMNYPYNDLREDGYLTTQAQTGTNGEVNPSSIKMKDITQDIFTFHSPETTFSNPYLSVNELKIYQECYGQSIGQFVTPYKHPKFKTLTNADDVIGSIVGIIEATSLYGKGINIGATADNPLGMTIGPLTPFPHKTSDQAGVSTSTPDGIADTVEYYAQIAVWVAEAAETAIFISQFVELQKEKFLSLMLMVIPKIQNAVQYISHGYYNKSLGKYSRNQIVTANYVQNGVQEFNQYQINNVNRSQTVVIQTSNKISNPSNIDDSRNTMGELNANINDFYTSTISGYYTAIKTPLPSQYGQLDSIKQLIISPCVQNIVPKKNAKYTSDVMFGGDVYINRYTEKNTMFFFQNWLLGEPDEIEYDYTLYFNVPYPRYWINNVEQKRSILTLASNYRSLDMLSSNVTYINRGYFYLFVSGVRDFFVESEINLAYRDSDDELSKRFYDPFKYTDIVNMFRSDVIRSGNYYKYDYSLSISKLFNSSVTWGNMLPRDYIPYTQSGCYSYFPNRVIYSLPQNDISRQDTWRIFLPNNYKDFKSVVTSIKPIHKTGAIFMMKYMSPLMFIGTEQLNLDGTNTAITIGNGALFGREYNLQSITNVDENYEYGSNQSFYSSINTVHGIYWVSQNQGKVFLYQGQSLIDITGNGMKYWMSRHLPSELLKIYPSYPLYDNPVIGVGISMNYDGTNEIIYISKKDYIPLKNSYTFDENGVFYNGGAKISFSDVNYFKDASWTISYDPKTKMWVSFHDWIPTLMLGGKSHLISINNNSAWIHNNRCDEYCNFYGKDYSFDVEFVASMGEDVFSLRNIEYILEGYEYFNNCNDKFHILNVNFDSAMVYNSEQNSGILNLILQNNNPAQNLIYPIFHSNYIETLYSKVEQKYRMNQFYDITKKRNNETPMFITSGNGVDYTPNPEYIDYTKSPTNRKRFRHNVNRVFLSKKINGKTKLIFKISNVKKLKSDR